MFQYIKQSFLPRDITILTGTAIGGGLFSTLWSSASPLPTGVQRNTCSNVWSRCISIYPFLFQKLHGPHQLAWKCLSTSQQYSFKTFFTYLPKGMPMTLFSNRLPLIAGLSSSFLPSLPSPPPLNFGCELAIH